MRTPFLYGFPKALGRSKSQLADQFQNLADCPLQYPRKLFGSLLPAKLLLLNSTGKNSRQRLLPPDITFWGFLSQILSPGSSCREALTKIQVLCETQNQPAPDNDTSAYCKARARLEKSQLQHIHQHIARQVDGRAPSDASWKGRRTLLVDATTASMPDTTKNQEKWPQHSNQAKGCGFPIMKIVGLFSLASGAVLDFANGTKSTHENDLLYQLKTLFRTGDVLVGDRLYCTFANICWLRALGVDLLARNHARRKAAQTVETLGKNDRIIEWRKPTNQKGYRGLTKQLWDTLLPKLRLREVNFRVEQTGFRSQEISLVTTLLDSNVYPAEELAELYLKRWRIELWFDDIKTSMQMDVLRCKSPEMIEKELLMHMIAYNLIRGLMQDAAMIHHQPWEQLSFKGTVDRLKQWIWPIMITTSKAKRDEMIARLLASIAKDKVPQRPGRYEPRTRKRRPKAFPVMVKPRTQLRMEFLTKREAEIAAPVS